MKSEFETPELVDRSVHQHPFGSFWSIPSNEYFQHTAITIDFIRDIVGPGVDAPLADVAPDPLAIALEWIGFPEATRHRVRLEGFSAFSDLKSMNEKDIRDLADSYRRRTIGNGDLSFDSVASMTWLVLQWVQDFQHVCGIPSLDEFNGDPDTFKEALDVAFNRADIRRIEKEQADTVSKAADLGKFKDERKWP